MTLGAGKEDASSSLVAFVVAGMVFVGSVAAVLYTSGNIDSAGLDDGPAAASLHAEADSIADLLLESPGLTAAVGCGGPGTACDWDASATAADRVLGLGLPEPGNARVRDF